MTQVVGVAEDLRVGAVDLLEQDQPGEGMGEGRRPEGHLPGLGQERRMQSVGRSDHESDMGAFAPPDLQFARPSLRAPGLALGIEADPHGYPFPASTDQGRFALQGSRSPLLGDFLDLQPAQATESIGILLDGRKKTARSELPEADQSDLHRPKLESQVGPWFA